MSPSDFTGSHEPDDTSDSTDMPKNESDAVNPADEPGEDDNSTRNIGVDPRQTLDGEGTETIDVEELMRELERLREEVTQLRARQAASRHSSWVQRHPALTVFLTTALGAAAGYLGSRLNASSDFSRATREQLRMLAKEARSVASDVQHEIETFSPLRQTSGGSSRNGNAIGSGNGSAATAQTPAGDASAGAPGGGREPEGSGFSIGNVLESVAETATLARDTVRDKAKTATEDAAAEAVRNFASDDDLVPVEMKAKAAGMAATTLGAALARKLVRSAGSIIASMLIAYLTKKVVDLLLRR